MENIKDNRNKESKLINIIFFASLGIVTICAVILTLVISSKPFKITSAEDLKEVTYDTYKTQKPEEYYIYIYTSEDVARAKWYSDLVCEYANYARVHSSALPIYGYNYEDEYNQRITTELGSSLKVGTDFPCLIKIKNGVISTKYMTWTKLSNELTEAMDK